MRRLTTLLLLLALTLAACSGHNDPADTETSTETETEVQTEAESALKSVEDMTEIEGVTAVTKLDQYCTNTELAYRVDFEVDGLKRYFEIALPADYAQNEYPCVLYFPEVGTEANFIVENFATKDIIVIRMYQRGSRGNEGVNDFCGKDFNDTQALFAFCKACPFLSRGGVFSAGASTGSVFALKLAAEYPDEIDGCIIIDAICDFESFAEYRGEDMQKMLLYMFDCSEEEYSAECAKRSPKYFYESIKAPVLMFCYTENPLFPNEQSEELKALLDGNGCDTELEYLSPVNSDFNGTAFMKLIPWIKDIAGNTK